MSDYIDPSQQQQAPTAPQEGSAPVQQVEQQPVEQQAQPVEQQPSSADSGEQSFPLKFVKRETGRTHTIEGGARTVPIVHGETGEPEAEYALLASIEGVEIALASYNAGRLETQILAAKRTQQQQSEG